MKKFFTVILFSLLIVVISGCSKKGQSNNEHLPVIAATSEMKLIPSENLVENFLNKSKDITTKDEIDDCFNITPDFIADNSSFTIFKYNSTTASFLMYDNEKYILGEYFGGSGVTSMALADLDDDNQYEFYFTFSWGSGIHRSQIGYFNPTTKKVIVFDYSNLFKDMMLTTNKDGDLLVNEAVIKDDYVSFVDFTIKSTKLIGSIISEKDSINLNITDHDFK